MTPAPRRRLIKADLTLRLSNSFDDDDDDINKDNNRNSEKKSTSSDENVFNSQHPEPVSLPSEKNSEETKKTRRFSLKNCKHILCHNN